MIPRTLALISILWASSAMADAGAAPTPGTCQLLQVQQSDMDTTTTGEFSVAAAINEHPYQLLVDTGSPFSSVSHDAVYNLGLQTVYTPFGGTFPNGARIDHIAFLKSLSIGVLHNSTGMRMLVDPEKIINGPNEGGLLGLDVMSQYDVEFDFYHGKFTFFMHNTCPDPVYWSQNFAQVPMEQAIHIVVNAALDGKPVRVILDTGAPTSTMGLEQAQDLFGWRARDPRLKFLRNMPINDGPEAPVYVFPFTTLTLGSVTVMNPKIQLLPEANFELFKKGGASVVLGMSVLRQLRLYAAFQERKLYVTAAEAH